VNPSNAEPMMAVKKPPAKPSRSTTSVLAPLRAAATAAPMPAQPAPQTSTSGRSVTSSVFV
jgi:hypothetical protein